MNISFIAILFLCFHYFQTKKPVFSPIRIDSILLSFPNNEENAIIVQIHIYKNDNENLQFELPTPSYFSEIMLFGRMPITIIIHINRTIEHRITICNQIFCKYKQHFSLILNRTHF